MQIANKILFTPLYLSFRDLLLCIEAVIIAFRGKKSRNIQAAIAI